MGQGRFWRETGNFAVSGRKPKSCRAIYLRACFEEMGSQQLSILFTQAVVNSSPSYIWMLIVRSPAGEVAAGKAGGYGAKGKICTEMDARQWHTQIILQRW